jgi:hypothetical protein
MNQKAFFHPMEGSGQLSISWSPAAKGAAVEAKKGNVVGFFADTGDLLSVIFDDISADEDHQTLDFKKYKIEISVKDGIFKHKVTHLTRPKPTKRTKKTTRSTLKSRRSKTKR